MLRAAKQFLKKKLEKLLRFVEYFTTLHIVTIVLRHSQDHKGD